MFLLHRSRSPFLFLERLEFITCRVKCQRSTGGVWVSSKMTYPRPSHGHVILTRWWYLVTLLQGKNSHVIISHPLLFNWIMLTRNVVEVASIVWDVFWFFFLMYICQFWRLLEENKHVFMFSSWNLPTPFPRSVSVSFKNADLSLYICNK